MTSTEKAQLSKYLRTDVVDAVDHDYPDADENQRKVLYLLEESGINPRDVTTIDHSDGKVDAFAIQDEGDGHLSIDIWQLSGPTLADIRAGRVKTPPNK